MKVKGFAISKPLRGAFYGSFGILLISGVVWLYSYFFLSERTDYGTIPSSYEAWSMQVHGAAVPVFLIIFGWLFPTHITRAYRARKNAVSGLVLLASMLWLILTGYLLYYCGHEGTRRLSSVTHSVIGVSVVIILALHIILGRRVYRSDREDISEEAI